MDASVGCVIIAKRAALTRLLMKVTNFDHSLKPVTVQGMGTGTWGSQISSKRVVITSGAFVGILVTSRTADYRQIVNKLATN